MSILCWIQDSLSRVYPTTRAKASRSLKVSSAKNESISFQACVRNEDIDAQEVSITVSAPDFLDVQIRRVGYVPIPHFNTGTPLEELDGVNYMPGFAPDPLVEDRSCFAGPFETISFWITANVDRYAPAGSMDLRVGFLRNGELISESDITIIVHDIALQPRKDFPVTHWFYADALCDWYNVDPFEDAFWPIVEPYMRDLTAHGNNCMYVPIFTPPTDGVKRPTQLLNIDIPKKGVYRFDFSNVKQWISIARKCGAEMFEWTHLFSQWGVENALRVYRDNNDDSSLLWDPDTPATSDIYKNFLAQFLPEFHKFLVKEGLLDKSIFHVSDEPQEDHLENYRAARSMLEELAPWMKVADALSDIRFGKEGLTDIPIPIISAARLYREADIPAWTYFCCGPRGAYLNRLIDTPLAKIRMAGWLFYRLGAKGFLHWGYNYWYRMQTRQLINPYQELAGFKWPGIAYGDPFVVYPGVDGPVDSIRWEVFAQSLQDYALLQTIGVDPHSDILSGIKEYDQFPKNADWITATRNKLLSQFYVERKG